MAYSNVTPPTLPEYDSETYGFYLLVFNYRLNEEDWYMCHLIYGAWRFQYEDGLGVTNTGTTFTRTYSEGSWAEETQNTETLALNPGASGVVYQRIYTNANIFNGDEIWLAENSVTPVEGQKFPVKDFINGMIMALCGSAVQWPKREPVAFLYGVPVENGEELSEYRHVGLLRGGVVTYYYALIAPPLPKETAVYSACVMSESISGTPWLFTGKAVEYETYNGKYELTLTEHQPWWYGYDDGWKQSTTIPVHNRVGEVDSDLSDFIVWTSVDILYEDGSVCKPATDPIPVSGEIVDYINEIPIYEVI